MRARGMGGRPMGERSMGERRTGGRRAGARQTGDRPTGDQPTGEGRAGDPRTGQRRAADDPRDVHRRLLALSPAARVLVGATIACGALAAVAVIVQAWVVATTIGDAVHGHAPTTGPLVVLGVAILGRAVLAGASELLGRRAAERAMHVLRSRIAGRALRGRAAGTEEARRGDVVTAAVQGVDALGDYYARAVPAVALAGAVPVVVVAAIAWRQPVVGGLLAVTLPVLVVFMVLVGRASATHARGRQQALAVLGAHFLEVVRALPTLRAHGREAAQEETLGAVAERYREESMGALRVAFLSALVLELFATLGIAVAAATVGVLLATGHAELSTGLFVLLLAPEVYAPLRAAGQRFHAAEDGAQAARRALAFLDEPERLSVAGIDTARTHDDRVPDPARGPDPACDAAHDRTPTLEPAPDPARGALHVRHATVRGTGGRPDPLAPVDLRLPPGRSVALVGPSGAGKSTLLALLARLADPDAGAVLCDDVDLRAVRPEDWWRRIAWLPQRPGLPTGSLGDALRVAAGGPEVGDGPVKGVVTRGEPGGDPPEGVVARDGRGDGPADDGPVRPGPMAVEQRIARGLRLADAEAVLAVLPDGLRTRVGPGGRPMSAGQTQRLALAGALASAAPLVLLDEPTAHLDRASAERVVAGIVEACAGRTLVVATHDPELVARCDVVLRIDAGVASAAAVPARAAGARGVGVQGVGTQDLGTQALRTQAATAHAAGPAHGAVTR